MSARRSYSGCGPIPAQVVRLLPNAEAIADALARTVFASQWGDAIERAQVAANYPEREESERDAAPEGFEIPNLSGRDLCEEAPHDKAPERFGAYARDVVAQAVALAFAAPRGMETLERWNDADAGDVGHNLALAALGTGADEWEHDADGELAPTCDADGRLYLDLSEVWEPPQPTDAELATLTPRALRLLDPHDPRNAEPTDEQRAALVAAIRAAMDEHDPDTALETVSDLLRAHGVESVTLPDDDDTRLQYVNRGDTYDATLTHDGERFRVQSWGDAIERAEEARTFTTGETRCPHCSEWGDLLGGKPCESCGHSDS